MKRHSSTSSSSGRSDLRHFTVKMCLLALITLAAQMALYPYQQHLETARKNEAEDFQRSLIETHDANQLAVERLIGSIEFDAISLRMEEPSTRDERQLDFLLLGDSTTLRFTTPDDYHIPESTWQLLAQKLPGCNVLALSSRGLNFVMYDLIVRYLREKTDHINTIILPLNVRSFGASWFYSDTHRFEKMRTALIMGRMNLQAFERPARLVSAFQTKKLSPEYLSNKVTEEYNDLTRRERIEYGTRDISSLTIGPARIAYNYEIDSAHPLFQALDSLASHCQETDTRLILYAIPINFEWIEDNLGEFTARTARQNLKILADYCEKSGIELLDYTDALPGEEVLIRGSTAGHLRGIGRAHLAELIASSLRARGLANCEASSTPKK